MKDEMKIRNKTQDRGATGPVASSQTPSHSKREPENCPPLKADRKMIRTLCAL